MSMNHFVFGTQQGWLALTPLIDNYDNECKKACTDSLETEMPLVYTHIHAKKFMVETIPPVISKYCRASPIHAFDLDNYECKKECTDSYVSDIQLTVETEIPLLVYQHILANKFMVETIPPVISKCCRTSPIQAFDLDTVTCGIYTTRQRMEKIKKFKERKLQRVWYELWMSSFV